MLNTSPYGRNPFAQQGTHSFWASMITRTLSLVEAVDGTAPTTSRKLLAISLFRLGSDNGDSENERARYCL